MFKTVYLQAAGVSNSDPLTLGDPVGYTVASVFMLFSQYSHELIILRFNSLRFTPSEVVQLEQSCYSSWGDASEFRPHQFSHVDDARRPPSSLWSRLFMLRVHRARQVTWLLNLRNRNSNETEPTGSAKLKAPTAAGGYDPYVRAPYSVHLFRALPDPREVSATQPVTHSSKPGASERPFYRFGYLFRGIDFMGLWGSGPPQKICLGSSMHWTAQEFVQ